MYPGTQPRGSQRVIAFAHVAGRPRGPARLAQLDGGHGTFKQRAEHALQSRAVKIGVVE